MTMQPEVLLLDEPTGQLDPIAAGEFLAALGRINRELGTTIIISEHRLEEVFPYSDRVVVLDEGQIIANAPPAETGCCSAKTSMPCSPLCPCQCGSGQLLIINWPVR